MSAAEQLAAIVASIPYARFLGMRGAAGGGRDDDGDALHERLIGNPALPAIHGGVLGALWS